MLDYDPELDYVPEPVPKIRVFSSDGKGTALWNQQTGPDDRTWFAPPAADCAESLYVDDSGMILRCFHAKQPRLTGSAECGDLFDAESYAVNSTPSEAVEWLGRYGYAIPDDLRRAVESGCKLATFAHLWTAKLRRLVLPRFDAEDRGKVLYEIGMILEDALSCGAFRFPAMASVIQLVNPPVHLSSNRRIGFEGVAKAFIDAISTVDQSTNSTLVATLADRLDSLEVASRDSKKQVPLESAPAIAAETVARALALTGEGAGLKVWSIARDGTKSANDRMWAIVAVDSRYRGLNSIRWGELLEVTPEAVRQTDFWKQRPRKRR